MKSILIPAFLVLLCACNGFSGKKEKKEDSLQYYPPTPASLTQNEFRYYRRTLAAFFDTMLPARDFNGGLIVAKDGNVLYEKYSGMIDIRKNDPITDSTPFHLASVGKTFTGTAILQLVQQNKLSLSDTLEKFFAGFPYHGVTVKMLLTHRSGLPNYVYFIPDSKKWDIKKYITNQEVLNFMMTEQPKRAYPPGVHYMYCNTNYLMLALIIERVTGQLYPQYMQEHFFTPLQMTHTYVWTLADTLRATPSFNYNSSFWQHDCLDETYGDKNIYSTPRDLLKWDQALYTDQVINQAMKDSAFAPTSFEKPSIHNYGMGWHLLMMPNGKKVVYHFGRWHGFNAAFARLTDEKVTIIIVGNKFTWRIYNTARIAYDIFGPYLQRKQDEDDDAENSAAEKTKKQPVKKSRKPILQPKKHT